MPRKSRAGLDELWFIELARELRQKQTLPELMLWTFLRNRALGGHKFRRQHQFGPYVLDFYCHEARLVVELDGAGHFEGDHPQRDRARDAFLEAEGLEILRFTNQALIENTRAVLERILERARERGPSP